MVRFIELRWLIIDRPGAHEHKATYRNRCTYCGHRVGNVRQTREEIWRVPVELVGRFLAMRSVNR